MEPVNIYEENGNADEYCCTESGDISTAITMLGWDELDWVMNQFNNPVWFKVEVLYRTEVLK